MVEGVSGVKQVLLLMLAGLSLTSRVGGSNPADTLLERRVITAKMIRHAGLTRVGDLLLLIDDWNINTTDGFTWKASPNGLSAFQRQNWVVMLDGQRIDPKVFDVINLNMAPVALHQIDYVEVIGLPQVHAGEFADRGLIHIRTIKPKPGISIMGDLVLGNETGDSGPYRFTEFATPNVDRIANDGFLTVDVGARFWYARAYLLVQQHPFTDPAMFGRISKTLTIYPGLHQSIVPGFKMGAEALGGTHQFLISYPFSLKYFLFLKPIGREIPVYNYLPHVGINGSFPASEKVDITYRLSYAVNELDRYPNTLDFDFDWESHYLNANIESNSNSAGFNTRFGIGYEQRTLNTGYALSEASYDIGKIYGELTHRFTDSIQQNTCAMILFSGGRTAFKAATSNYWKMNDQHTLGTSLSFSQRLIEEDNSLWYWSERGYDILRANDVDYTIFGNINKSQQFTGDLTWKTTVNDNFTIETIGSYRLFSDLYLERQSLQFNPQDYSFYSPIQIYGGKKGQVIGGKIAVNHRFIPQLSHQLSYSYWTEIAGDDVFKDVWASIPKHKACYRLTYTPVESFAIWAMVSYRSATSWSDYLNVDGQIYEVAPQVTVTYASTVKGVAIFDLQIQKWFWHGRLIGDLLFRNVWNQDYRYHPIGASFDLSMFIKVKVLLNS